MDETFRLNTFSSMLLTSLCLPLLRKGSTPCVINMTSIAARRGAHCRIYADRNSNRVGLVSRPIA